ncbi:MAG TPA: DNA-3-methyladenine glycosylase [Candidatus Paceibacterota bacterium]|nr:DNA-3-methyladenine glycosylase [Candidatus Paceibacterota bacterium]
MIRAHGPIDLTRYHASSRGVFASLLRSIVYQQISGKAAASILARLLALYPNGKTTPDLVSKTPMARLRKAGLSSAKAIYVKDLAKKYLDGTIDEKKFSKMSSQEIIDHLVQVKGIGEWTAHMVLIFTLYRPDILPVGDLAIRKGFQAVYGLREMPSKREMEKIAKPWRAHATAASWYLWRVADTMKPAPKVTPLPRKFYDREPAQVAKDLLGKFLVRKSSKGLLMGMITETEAYLPTGDSAAHSFKGRTARNTSLYTDGGHAYVHSMRQYCLLDIVTESPDKPGSVLIRSIKPISGIAGLINGPGKVCRELAITRSLDGVDITDPRGELLISKGEKISADITISTRIGISKAKNMPLRFQIAE